MIRRWTLITFFFCGFVPALLFAQAPVIGSFSPVSGFSGSSVTIEGQNFDAAHNVVLFGGIAAHITSSGTNKIVANVPLSAITGPVTVINLNTGLTAVSAGPFNVTFTVPDKMTASNLEILTHIPVQNTRSPVIAADLNADGKPDLIVLDGKAVSIFQNINNSAAINSNSFAAKFDLSTNGSPYSIQVADLDGDGKPDIIVPGSSNSLTIYKNISSPGSTLTSQSFQQIYISSFATNGYYLEVADMDGDGKPDIVCADAGDDHILILKNLATAGQLNAGSFSQVANIPYSGGDIAVVDLDNDGKPDIFCGNAAQMFHNQVTGNNISDASFAKIDFPANGATGHAAAADIDGDGKPEILIADNANGFLYLFQNQSANGALAGDSFVLKNRLFSGSKAISVGTADVDGDGKVDVVVANSGAHTIAIFKNIFTKSNPSGPWLDTKLLDDIGTEPIAVSAADFNGDGRPDLIIPDADGFVTIIKNEPAGIPVIKSFSPAVAQGGSVITIKGKNFTNSKNSVKVYFGTRAAQLQAVTDSVLQVVVPPGVVSDRIGVSIPSLKRTVWSAQAFKGTYASKKNISAADFKFSLRMPLAQYSKNIKLADFDGDGFLDLIYIEDINGQITIQRNNGNAKTIDCTLFTKALSLPNPKQFTSFIIGDINNDGLPDLICDGGYFLNTSTKGDIQFAPFTALFSNPVQDVQPYFLEDLDGDGRLDIVTSSGTFRNGTTENSTSPEVKSETNILGGAALADFDGDGKPDILNGDLSGGSLSIGANVSSPGFLSDSSFSKAVAIGPSSAAITVMDLDNDGKIDIASGDAVYKNNSTAPGNFLFQAATGNWPTDFGFVNDLNGDGLPDLIAAKFPENFFIRQNRTAQGQPPVTTDSVRLICNDLSPIGDILIDPDFLAAEDLNNDNKPELIFYDDRLNQLLIFENTNFAESDPSLYITAVTPAQGNINKQVTITGGNFDPVAANNTVFFGNTQAVISSASKSSLSVAVPAGAGYGQITVNNNTTKRSAQSTTPFKVLIGDGSGQSISTATFNPIQPLLNKLNGGNFTFGDFNNDGKEELALLATDSIFIYKSTSTDSYNNPTGFTKITSFATGTLALRLFSVDLNGDNKPELIVSEDDGLRIYENTSNAECGISFVSNLVEDNIHPDDLTFGDMDGDGKPDIIVASGGITRIYLNNSGRGSISFRPWVYVDIPLELNWLHAVDFDGDGKTDLVGLNSNTIVVYRNLGGIVDSTVNFADPVSILSPSRSYSLMIADMDGDGKPDVVVPNDVSNTLEIYKNNCTPGNVSAASVAAPVSFDAGAQINQLFMGDFNGDGKPDIYTTIINKYQINVFANNSVPGTIDNSSFSAPVIFSTGNEVVNTFPLDLNKDGKQDIMFSVAGNTDTSIKSIQNNTLASAIELFSSGANRTYIVNSPAILVDSAISVNNTSAVNISSAQVSISQNYQSGSDILNFASISSSGNISGSFDAASGILTLTSAGSTATNAQWKSALRAVTFQSTVKTSGLRTIGFTAGNGTITSAQVTAAIIVTVIPPPAIVSISPLFATAGDNVIITGTNFTDAIAVSFGGTKAASFVLNLPTSVSAVLASGASGKVSVTTPYGTGQFGGFTYVPVPVITAGGPTTFNPGGSVMLSTTAISGLTYQWAKDGADIPGAESATYTATATGNYAVSVLFNSGEKLTSAITRVNAVFSLPADNFTVSATSATCRGTNDGSINISAKQPLSYQATVSGVSLNDTYSFTTNKELDNLEPGDYSICIKVPSEPGFEQCFTISIGQPQDLSVYTAVNPNDQTVSIQMSGGDNYEVKLNGINYSTSQSQITLRLAKGNNDLIVSTGKSCQGVVEKRIITDAEIVPYPNPFSDVLMIDLGTDISKTAEVTVVDMFGKKVYQNQVKCINGKITIGLASLPSGMYMLQLKLDSSETVYKIWKE